jgi:hypothetical protein
VSHRAAQLKHPLVGWSWEEFLLQTATSFLLHAETASGALLEVGWARLVQPDSGCALCSCVLG